MKTPTFLIKKYIKFVIIKINTMDIYILTDVVAVTVAIM